MWQLRQKVHVSWLIAGMAAGIVLGVIAAAHIEPGSFSAIVWLLLGMSLCGICLWRRRSWVVLIVIMGGVLVGLWRGSVVQHDLTVYQNLIGSSQVVQGVVSEDPDIGKRGQTTLRLDKIRMNGYEMPGKLWIDFGKKQSLKRSDVVTIKGKVTEGFANFSASIYRAELQKIQRPQPGDIALQARDSFADQVRRGIDEPAVSLGLGYLLGQRRALPEDLEQSLRIAGLMHVVVASGYNLTILVRFARRTFAKISKYLATFVSILLIGGFIGVTGISPSMSRAGLIAGLSLAAWYYGRKISPFVLLPFAAAITLLINPAYGWNDLGWSLSFAAFAGVIIIAPLAQTYFFGPKKPGVVRQIAGETIAAQLVTLPLLLGAFGVMSTVALAANLLILPLVPLAMLLVFITGLAGFVAPQTLVEIIGQPAQWLLDYMVIVASMAAGQEWSQLELALLPWMTVGCYFAIAITVIWMWRATKFNFRDTNVIE